MFQKGNTFGKGGHREGSGRKPSKATVIKRFIDEHPAAYETLMNKLYSQGKEGDITAAQYVCDRLKGKPGVKIDLEIGVKPYDTLIKEISLQAFKEPVILIEEGKDADRTSQEGLPEGVHEKEKG